jgi:MoxR-like ATPase
MTPDDTYELQDDHDGGPPDDAYELAGGAAAPPATPPRPGASDGGGSSRPAPSTAPTGSTSPAAAPPAAAPRRAPAPSPVPGPGSAAPASPAPRRPGEPSHETRDQAAGRTVSSQAVVDRFAEDFAEVVTNVEQVVHGKTDVVRRALLCLFSEGHLLVEDVPGVGKTTLARAIAASIDATWQRIQFTPDLLPSDVTGVSIYNQATQLFEFHPGPVFANIVVGDEINRASPKTQAALLEVMEEGQVTVEGRARPVSRPFLVIATQNPVEMDGTYRLPEAQLDRFLMRISVGYPDDDAEVEIVANRRRWRDLDALSPVLSAAAVQRMAEVATGVHVAEAILRYVTAISSTTRSLPGIRLGVSPRGGQALVRVARAMAASRGRAYVTPDDVKELAEPVLAHRIMLDPEAELAGHTPSSVLAQVLERLPAPTQRAPAER